MLRYFRIIDLYAEKKSQSGRNVTLPPATAGGDVTLQPAAAATLLTNCYGLFIWFDQDGSLFIQTYNNQGQKAKGPHLHKITN